MTLGFSLFLEIRPALRAWAEFINGWAKPAYVTVAIIPGCDLITACETKCSECAGAPAIYQFEALSNIPPPLFHESSKPHFNRTTPKGSIVLHFPALPLETRVVHEVLVKWSACVLGVGVVFLCSVWLLRNGGLRTENKMTFNLINEKWDLCTLGYWE
ncbi:hypothetical protein AAG906_022815 [Vitis piasezkii]